MEFRAEQRNFDIAMEFDEVKKWPMICTIIGFKLTISQRKIKLNCLKLRPY